MKLRKTQTNDTLHIYDDASADKVNKQIERKLLEGDYRIDNGVKTFIDDREVIDTSKQGS
ncbi:MAG: hypothetical protein IH969_07795, partial [Candidatus Krumholzibacteriota bacterium]|nr:hypothetical protein [Candidatus Krumholzibacteriota bacterium]